MRHLLGWVGPRRALVEWTPPGADARERGLLDLERRALREVPSALARWRGPIGLTADGAVLTRDPDGWVSAHRLVAGAWRVEVAGRLPERPTDDPLLAAEVAAGDPLTAIGRSADGARLAYAAPQLGVVVYGAVEAETGRPVRGRRVRTEASLHDPARDRLVWLDADGLHAEPLMGDGPARTVPLPPGPTRVAAALADGRVAVASPLRVVDLDAGTSTRATGPRPVGEPLRLARDGRRVLGFDRAGGALVAAEVGGAGAGAAVTVKALRARRDYGRWHPRAEAGVALLHRGAAAVQSPDGPLLELPPDAEPMAWTPDGRALLVRRLDDPARRSGVAAGALEVWSAGLGLG